MTTTDDQGPDLTRGIPLADLDDGGMLRGRVGKEPVLLIRRGDEILAVGAECTHYGGPLVDGLVVDDTVRCPWHHACFSLRTGEALGAPAFDGVGTWDVDRDGDLVVVRGRRNQPTSSSGSSGSEREREQVVIVGGGAAGLACAEMLRRHGYPGRIRMLSADRDAPYDRPALSKDFLGGDGTTDDLPLRDLDYYERHDIDLRLGVEVTSLDLQARTVSDGDGGSHEFDHLVLATGSEPARPPIPGADRDEVFTLRSVADASAIVRAAERSETAVLLGSGFIGLEVAASLTERGVRVHVVTQDEHPLEAVMGRELGDRIRAEHESHGTVFHTEMSLERIDEGSVVLEDGTRIECDLVVLGTGVKPRVDLARDAGLAVDDGVLVDVNLCTTAPGVYAVGDIARWRDSGRDRTLRIEHWVLAERHGQHVAGNILHGDRPFTDVPFFWTKHHDVQIRYAGHAEDWDEVDIDGDLDELDCQIRYRKDGDTLAVATLGRDLASLEWEAAEESRMRAI